jgi:hypothetical protein
MTYPLKPPQPVEPQPHEEELTRSIPTKAKQLAILLCLMQRRVDPGGTLQCLEAQFIEDAKQHNIRLAKRRYWLEVLALVPIISGGGALLRIIDLIRAIMRLYTGW